MGGRVATASPGEALSEALAEQASQWIVRLSADDAAERERARSGFEAWKRADARHAEAAARLEGWVGQVSSLRGARPARAALAQAFAVGRRGRPAGKRRKRAAVLAALGALVLAVAAGVTLQACPPAHLLADVRTGTGRWDTRTLPDGTRITLDSGSAVNLRYDARHRAIELVGGRVLVDVAHDASRRFFVDTAHGRFAALGTRFTVSREADATVLQVLESRVAVQAAAQPDERAAVVVAAGQGVRVTPDGIEAATPVDAGSVGDAWARHQLVVRDAPLAGVLDELGRHRRGHLGYAPAAVEGIRVSAVLPLDDTDRALQLLLAGFPELRVRTLTPYLVWVDRPAAP